MKTFLMMLLVVSAGAGVRAQTQAQFQVPIVIANGTFVDTLVLGVSGDGPGGSVEDNTIGVDFDGSFGTYQELVAPPPPPPPYSMDVRFMTIPGRVSTFPVGLGGGVYKDFRGFTAPSQIDTFRIQILGDDVDLRETVVSWPSGLAGLASAWTIRPQSGNEWGSVNMLGTTSATLPTGILQRNILIIKDGALTSVAPVEGSIPGTFELSQNYPNPFNPSTEIRFSLPQAGRVSLKVYNVIGQEVAALVDEVLPAGLYRVQFNASGLSSGMYIARLQGSGRTMERKMLLVK